MTSGEDRSSVPAGYGSHSDHEHVGRISTGTTFVVLAVIAVVLYEIKTILPPFVLPAILAYICGPGIEWLSARTGYSRTLFAVAFFIVLTAFAFVLGYLGLPPLLHELTRVLGDLQGTLQEFFTRLIGDEKINLFNQPMDATALAQTVTNDLRERLSQSGTLGEIVALVFGSMFALSLSIIVFLYFLIGGPGLARGLLKLVPPQNRPLILHLWSRLDPVLKRYFIGLLLVVAYASTAAYIGLGFALKLPHAASLALMTGILEMIPVLGPFAAAVIAGLVALQHSKGIGAIIAYAAYATALRLSIDQLFGPIVLGTAARVHPTVVIFGFLIGAYLFGLAGVVLAIPVAIAIKTTLQHLYDEEPTA